MNKYRLISTTWFLDRKKLLDKNIILDLPKIQEFVSVYLLFIVDWITNQVFSILTSRSIF